MLVREFISTPGNLSVISFHTDGKMRPLSFEMNGWKNISACEWVDDSVPGRLLFGVVHQEGRNVLEFDCRTKAWSHHPEDAEAEQSGEEPAPRRRRPEALRRDRSHLQVIDGGAASRYPAIAT